MSKPRHLLVVDDEEALRDLWRMRLELEDYKVTCARSGNEAFEVYSEASPPIDFIISDVRMPDGDGISLLQKIRSIDKKIPVICLVSGQLDIDSGTTVDDVLSMGANVFFEKPVDPEKLVEFLSKTETST